MEDLLVPQRLEEYVLCNIERPMGPTKKRGMVLLRRIKAWDISFLH